jgi:uncharacterized protein YkwD
MWNLVDLIIVIVILMYVIHGVRLGAWLSVGRLLALVGSVIGAFALYQRLGAWVSAQINLHLPFAYVLAFLIIFIIVQIIIQIFLNSLYRLIPESWKGTVVGKIVAVIPAVINGLIFVALMVILVIVLPISPDLRDRVSQSVIGGEVMEQLPAIEQRANHFFGGALDQALTHILIRPGTDETINIPHRPKTLAVDEATEERMLELINRERLAAGVPPVVIDRELTEVARLHSRDMWERGFFAHNNPDGESPFDRMREGRISFLIAGENIALAPALGLAHRGLMNSPGHRENILDPRFGRVGIGVIDGGAYGKMFTQKFTN